ncbi:hypothetical protein QRX50_23285 [Amycolatopsis carbonis]|uniref:Uncharacterized protein n=1 Tax=Amycolatopsis carbonis TaxID=715471 RepID=A0A9Y2MW20_9PSEU|nr:hypothetical protein [Amycolatopsis sp. 2-15]WIX83470.1 hypothetical protein QRX50_23285 [Amycolatopsis sp. 2-15]
MSVAGSGAQGSPAQPLTRRLGPGRAYLAGMALASAAGLVAAGGCRRRGGEGLHGAWPALCGVNQQTLRQTLIAPELLSHATAT